MNTSAFSRQVIRAALLTAACAGLIASAAYFARRASCETDARGMVGEVKRASDGHLLYFDGQCWTRKPMPPTDTPF